MITLGKMTSLTTPIIIPITSSIITLSGCSLISETKTYTTTYPGLSNTAWGGGRGSYADPSIDAYAVKTESGMYTSIVDIRAIASLEYCDDRVKFRTPHGGPADFKFSTKAHAQFVYNTILQSITEHGSNESAIDLTDPSLRRSEV